jgi:hypothetical protein
MNKSNVIKNAKYCCQLCKFIGAALFLAISLTTQAESLAEHKLSYTIIKENPQGEINRRVEVLLPERVDEKTLELIAKEIKATEKSTFERTFIGWYVKGVENGMYWANAEFDPDLTIKIIGSSIQEHAAVKNIKPKIDGDIFGSWLNNQAPTWEFNTVGYKKKGKIFFKDIFSNGSSNIDKYVEKQLNGKKIFELAGGNKHKEYYVINEKGELEFWGSNGKFYTAKPIQLAD